MSGETNLDVLLTAMQPRINPGRFVYTTVTGDVPADITPVVTVHEAEGHTLILPQDDADKVGLDYDYVAAWITLRVHSSLDAVGLTAAVATKFVEVGLSCNVVAGYHHDHLFVPYQRARDAMAALESLSALNAQAD